MSNLGLSGSGTVYLQKGAILSYLKYFLWIIDSVRPDLVEGYSTKTNRWFTTLLWKRKAKIKILFKSYLNQYLK